MPIFVLFFLIGDLYFQLFTAIALPLYVFPFILISIFYPLIGKYFFHIKLILIFFMLGWLWTAGHAYKTLSWNLAKNWENKPLLVTGHISSLPFNDKIGLHFNFQTETLQYNHEKIVKKINIKLLWRNAIEFLHVGDKWQFYVRLKRIHSTQNLGGFDFEAWALAQGLRAQGYILLDKNNILLVAHHWYDYPINQFRQFIQNKITMYLPPSETSPWLMALIIGEHEGMPQNQWQILRNTGTNHLFAIAGLHIGLLCAGTYLLVTYFWRLFPLLILKVPVKTAGAIGSLTVAILYGTLSGFALPAQRACIMLYIFMLGFLAKRKINVWYIWSCPLLMILLLNPMSVLSESFWLSFVTIALIIYAMNGRLNPNSLWWRWGRVQWIIGSGLIPFSILFFHQITLVAFIANIIAIPWLACLILPFCFMSIIFAFISPIITQFLLLIADKSAFYLWKFLAWLSKLHGLIWFLSFPNSLILMLSVLGFIFLLLPRGCSGKWLGLVWLLPITLNQPYKPDQGQVWLTLFDVGQGLSVFIQTLHHTLLFDTGPRYPMGLDMGESVIVPYLQTINVSIIDLLVISHGDNDHIGGAKSVLDSLAVKKIATSVPEKFLSAQYCLEGETWEWDGVRFSFLYPSYDNLNLNNNSSCVLRIDNGVHSILLTGDVENHAEKILLKNNSNNLAADILIAPHHGSKTSGLKKFISTVHPSYVLYATGYNNRYHFPNADVVTSYEIIKAQQFNTAKVGMIQFKIAKDKKIATPFLMRLDQQKYWFDR